MILVLLQAPDLAVSLARAESRVRQSVVAIPLAPELPTAHPGDDWARYAARAERVMEAVSSGFARRDRPLLITPRAANAHELQGWPLLGPVGRMVEAMSDRDLKEGGGFRMSGPMAELSEADRQLVRAKISPGGVIIDGVPAGPERDRLQVTINPGLAFYDEKGEGAGVSIRAERAPFDPTRYLGRLRFKEPDPVPEALAKAFSGRTVALPANSLSLPAWADLLRGDRDLRVDGRAKVWRVALGAPGPSVRVVDALRAVARAQRLYWRPVGERWVLAASPGDPRPFANDLVRWAAMADFAPVLDRMARAGLLAEDVLALMAGANDRKVADLSDEDRARVRRLLASGEPWRDYKDRLDRMIAGADFGKATLNVNFSMNVSIERAGSSSGFGVMLP